MYECKIAKKLVELRASRGVTQEDVAKHLSVSNKTVSKWENGTSMPDLSMLVELSKYYGISTDALLGIAEDGHQSTKEDICSFFEGLDRKESILTAFETVNSIVPAMFGTITKHGDDTNNKENVIPLEISQFGRSKISLRSFYEFVASSEDVNVAVMMLRNKANFAWMNNPIKQKEIVKVFKFLSNEDVLSVLFFIHSTTCSESFTADYIAKNTGLIEERVVEILDEFCTVGACHWVIAHLSEGEVKVYECRGDGTLLSLIALAYERMCGNQGYKYNFRGMCKMIGGE